MGLAPLPSLLGGCVSNNPSIRSLLQLSNDVVRYFVNMVSLQFSVQKGGAPVSMSYIKVPRLHQSTALPYPVCCKISGAMYATSLETHKMCFLSKY